MQRSEFTQNGSVDYKGRPARKSSTGGWKACFFLLGNDLAERLAYYGIGSNLVTYLTDVLGQGLATASKNVNYWTGCVFFSSFLGAFLSDTFWGRYKACIFLSTVYLTVSLLSPAEGQLQMSESKLVALLFNLTVTCQLTMDVEQLLQGLAMLLSSVTVDALKPYCLASGATATDCTTKTTGWRLAYFFISLYILGVGAGALKPCLTAFGADQFDEEDEKEAPHRDSFFNLYFTMVAVGALTAVTVVVYVEDNVGWAWGIAIPTAAFVLAFCLFVLGSSLYRRQPLAGNPCIEVAQVLFAAVRKCWVKVPADKNLLYEVPGRRYRTPQRRQLLHTDSLTFLDKAATIRRDEDRSSPWKLSTVTQVEEVKLLVNTLPIWLLSLVYLASYAQTFTLFTRQGNTMDNRLGSHFRIPPSSFQIFSHGTVVVGLIVYDKCFVPLARRYTGNPRGISLLQRIGVGFFLGSVAMMAAALTEMQRLKYVRNHEVQKLPNGKLPLSIFRLVPQYVLVGLSEVFGIVGGIDFFYDQTPDHMRTVGSAIYLSSIGAGNFLSSALISITTSVSGRHRPWVGRNINTSRLDKFYGFLAILGIIDLIVYILVASRFRYKKAEASITPPAEESEQLYHGFLCKSARTKKVLRVVGYISWQF